jgi:HlyD family secretion protein
LTLANPVWIRAFVGQPRLGLIKPGLDVWLEVDAAPGKRFRGRVGFISPQAEFTPKTVETREIRDDLVFRFRVVAEDPDNLMRQGMPVTVIIPLRPSSGSSSGSSSESSSGSGRSDGRS